jgi:threonine dehydrogenase-like Zn-dependent dehydrogenase
MDFTNGDGMGRVCECSGAPVMVNSSFSYLRKGGTIVMENMVSYLVSKTFESKWTVVIVILCEVLF